MSEERERDRERAREEVLSMRWVHAFVGYNGMVDRSKCFKPQGNVV